MNEFEDDLGPMPIYKSMNKIEAKILCQGLMHDIKCFQNAMEPFDSYDESWDEESIKVFDKFDIRDTARELSRVIKTLNNQR